MGVVSRADLSSKHLQIIQKILVAFFPSCSVWAYGSRAKWTARPTSDLDMVIFADATNKRKLSQLREAFEESDLPFEVDAFLWDLVPENFRTHILESYVVLQENKQTVVPLVPLKDHCLKIGSGSTPRGGSSVYLKEGKTSFIRSQNIYNDKFDPNGLVYLSEEAADKLQNVALLSGDILLNITGDSVARVNLVPDKFLPARVNQHVAIIRPNPADFDARYLRYVLTSVQHQSHLLTLASAGATRNALTKGMIESYLVPKPPLLEQYKIANLLSAFDDKITLNNQINQTLEQMAQTLFKSWFVDFDPVKAKMNGEQSKGMDAPFLSKEVASLFPEKLVESELGLIPDGWGVSELSKLFELHRGFDLPKSKRQEGEYPVYAAGGYHGTHNEFKMEPPGIITGRSGVIGNVYLSLDKYWPLNTTLYVREFRTCGTYYAYHLLRSLDLKTLNSGSAVPSLNRNFVHSTNVCHPDSDVLAKFEEVVTPLFEKMVANNEQNKSLSELRDTLLPKLLSGEIDLDKIGADA